MDVSAFLDDIRGLPWYRDQIAHREDVASRAPSRADLAEPISPDLERALRSVGIDSFYTHQAQAIDAVRRGENVIVATPAASGKSLCYNVPVLDALTHDRSARALYIFPTKALTQDQARGFSELAPEGNRVRCDIFDGDTEPDERAQVRRNAKVVLTNPDMLHAGILPNHRSWHGFLRGLRYVVIDEAHSYRGVFGSHVAAVLRRLRRLCSRFGSDPRFILCSATLANPAEHAERLVGLPFRVVEDSGAPYAGKDFVFWNPPMIDVAEGRRRSTNGEAAMLLSELLRRHIRTLAFVPSRRMAELLYIWTRDQLADTSPDTAKRLAPYRAGYLPEDRRRIEKDMFEGRLLGLTTTSAMEMGVDIGDLDATLLSGYPGTIARTWQQAGRSGRRGERALTVMIARDNPLDQYLMRHPQTFFGKLHENARISTTNHHILKPQILCAAYEAPITAADAGLFDGDVAGLADEMVDEGLLQRVNGRWHLHPDVEYPAKDVSIRSASSSFYTLVEKDSGAILETVGEATAYTELHPGGIYLHQGESFLIADLDIEGLTAYAVKSDLPYYTEVRHLTDSRLLNIYDEKAAGATKAYLGEVAVTTTVVGFARKAHGSHEVIGEEYLSLPPQTFETVALWFDIPPSTLARLRAKKLALAGGLHAAEHAAIGVLPLFALCDRNDIGGISTPLHPDTGRPQVLIHDGHAGGVGIAEHGYEVIEDLWQATLEVVSECPCESGCPGCIHSPKCGNNNEPLDKTAAALILRELLAAHAP